MMDPQTAGCVIAGLVIAAGMVATYLAYYDLELLIIIRRRR